MQVESHEATRYSHTLTITEGNYRYSLMVPRIDPASGGSLARFEAEVEDLRTGVTYAGSADNVPDACDAIGFPEMVQATMVRQIVRGWGEQIDQAGRRQAADKAFQEQGCTPGRTF